MNDLVRKSMTKISVMAAEYYYALRPRRDIVQRLDDSPGALLIENTNACNANCTFCGYQFQSRPIQVMEESVFQKAIRQFDELGGGELALVCVVGDPLLDRRIVERIELARSYKNISTISTITNCLDLHLIQAERLLKSGLTTLTVSTVGFDEKMY